MNYSTDFLDELIETGFALGTKEEATEYLSKTTMFDFTEEENQYILASFDKD